MKPLCYFTYKVTMFFLNCIEKGDQNGLTQILPVLYNDLTVGKPNILSEYRVERTHIQIDRQSTSTELDKYLLLEMCKEAAEGVRMECGQEYFPEDERKPRTAQLCTKTEEERKNIPTENLVTEHYLINVSCN